MADIPDGMLQAHFVSQLAGVERRTSDADAAMARHRDTALHGLKTIEAIAAYELLVSNDGSDFARVNSAVRLPTTLDHPNAIVTK